MTGPTVGCAVLAGGVGAARLLRGLVRAVPAQEITAIVNTADDVVLHGLHVSPDLDTVTYHLAGIDNAETGWGLAGETWQALTMVRHYGGLDWFNLGDRDLGTHLFRTQRLLEGATLSEVTAEIAAAWGIELRLLPVTDDRIETRVTTVDEGEIGFQEYFVRRRHQVAVTEVRFAGAEACAPAPGVLDAIGSADTLIVAPSNPVVSIGPLLAVPGVREALAARRDRAVAISPIIAGKALKGPADRLMVELGHDASVLGVAALYRDLVGTLVVDRADAEHAPAIEELGMRCLVTDTVMHDPEVAARLCRTVLEGARAT